MLLLHGIAIITITAVTIGQPFMHSCEKVSSILSKFRKKDRT
jgi:hypothetical protein